ncbi:MAG: SusC/RagA family TonB-linked outer membrane protein [Niastella sp.]|nr:SusC/RagA family TonB-linked outer membrane protein [Niastella sp.]
MMSLLLPIEKLTRCNKVRLSLLLLAIVCLMSNAAQARQQKSTPKQDPAIKVSGLVLNKKWEPLAGVRITVKSTGISTTTDEGGTFELTNVPPNDTLLLEGLNIRSKVPVKGRKYIGIHLQVMTGNLDEVHVVGYTKTSRRMMTGAVAQVKAEQIEKQPVTNPLLALQGRVPGLFVVQSSGMPGTPVILRIRGYNSISNGKDPLIVLDGVPIPIDLGTGNSSVGLGGIVQFGNYLALIINPGDIESIDVLKDADATAIYGARAANGVIVITSKKGKEGRMQIELDARTGISRVAKKMDLLNTQQYLDMRRQAFKNDKANPATSFLADDITKWDTARYTDWQKELIGRSASFSEARVAVGWGNANMKVRIGGAYQRSTLVFPVGDHFNNRKISFNTNISIGRESGRFQVLVSFSGMSDRSVLPLQDLTGMAIMLPPHTKLKDSVGNIFWPANWNANAYAELLKEQYTQTYNAVGNAVLSYKLLDNLKIKLSLGTSVLTARDLQRTPLVALPPVEKPRGARMRLYHNNMYTVLAEPQLEYTLDRNGHKIEVLLGGTYQKSRNERDMTLGNGIFNDVMLNNIANATDTRAAQDDGEYKYVSAFGRLQYTLSNRYIFSLTGRRDGSSRFGADSRFATFGAIGGAWRFADERKVKEALPWLSDGKLRASYGTTGNDQIGNYTYLALYNTPIGTPAYQGLNGLAATGLDNPAVKWEVVRKINLGFDLGFFEDRIQLYVDAYRNRTSNQLLQQPVPLITGFPYITANRPAFVQNAGWEFLLNTINSKHRAWHWSTSFNISFQRNKLLKYPGLEESPYKDQLQVGRSINTIFLYQHAGVDALRGIYVFSNSEGRDTATPGPKDKFQGENLAPAFFGGLSNTVQWANFTLDILVSFAKQKGPNYLTAFPVPGAMHNQPVEALYAWNIDSKQANVQYYSQLVNSPAYKSYGFTQSSDAAYTDASYIRLKNIALSYQVLQGAWLTKMGLKSMSLSAQAQNLFTITGYKGLDPENQSFRALPPLQVIMLGIKATF